MADGEEAEASIQLVTVDDARPRRESESDSEKAAGEESCAESESALLRGESEAIEVKGALPLCRLFALSAVAFAIDLGYAVSDALLVPLLVGAGMSLGWAGLAVAVSPILGVVFQLFLGSLSDECRSTLGRRRPFILFLCLVTSAGFLAAPFAPLVSDLPFEDSRVLGIFLTVVAVLVLDFGLAQSQTPSRAYLLDSVPSSQLQTGNFIYTMYSGMGMCLGFVISGINWADVLGQQSTVINKAQVVFTVVAVITVATMFVTVCSVKEVPLRKSIDSEPGCSRIWKPVKDTVLFVSLMSKDMWALCLATLFGFIAVWAFLFFTTFVGEVIYGGTASAPVETDSYHLYTDGVQVASWGLAIGGAVSAVLSLFLDKLASHVGLKLVFLVIQYLFIVSCFFLTIAQRVWVVLMLSVTYGPYLMAFLTVPFTIVPAYHDAGKLLSKPWPNGGSVVGKACAVMYTMLFVGQSIAMALCGPISELLGTSSAAMMIACVAAGISFVITLNLAVPSNTK